MSIKFTVRWIPLIATAVAILIGILMGEWQTRRAMEKELIEAKLVERARASQINLKNDDQNKELMQYRRVVTKGQFVHEWPVYLDNRPYRSVAGFYVLMPFRIDESGKYVMVVRGWSKRNVADRKKVPDYVTPTGLVEIEGVIMQHPGHLLELGKKSEIKPGAIMQNLDINAFTIASKLNLYPFVIEQTNEIKDGLVRDWPRPSFGIEKHRGYAFQWYALAATAFIFFVVTGCSRERK